eukprot:4745985-Pleurochrysis_carterae.AAC.1
MSVRLCVCTQVPTSLEAQIAVLQPSETALDNTLADLRIELEAAESNESSIDILTSELSRLRHDQAQAAAALHDDVSVHEATRKQAEEQLALVEAQRASEREAFTIERNALAEKTEALRARCDEIARTQEALPETQKHTATHHSAMISQLELEMEAHRVRQHNAAEKQ